MGMEGGEEVVSDRTPIRQICGASEAMRTLGSFFTRSCLRGPYSVFTCGMVMVKEIPPDSSSFFFSFSRKSGLPCASCSATRRLGELMGLAPTCAQAGVDRDQIQIR